MAVMKYGISTTAMRLMDLEEKFATAKEIGFDGIEVMITHDREAHSYDRLAELEKQYELPVMSIHAPTLVATQFVWGTRPYTKLRRAAEHAAQIGAETVVVHPPFRWQPTYAKSFFDAVHHVNTTHQVHIAVENMYPWYIGGAKVRAYGVTWVQTKAMADSITFDFSHATVDGLNIVTEIQDILPHLRHVHLSDTKVGSKVDAHMVPGNGNLPLAEAFQVLRENNWQGQVVAEINTLRNVTKDRQRIALQQTLDRGRELING